MESEVSIILIMPDDELRELTREVLSKKYKVTDLRCAPRVSTPAFNKVFLESETDLVIFDDQMREPRWLDWLTQIQQAEFKEFPLLLGVFLDPDESVLTQAFDLGIAHYLLSPLSHDQLVMMVQSLIQGRRASQSQNEGQPRIILTQDQITVGNITLKTQLQDVWVGSERVFLTPNEYKLLECLISQPGQTLSRDELLQKMQGEGVTVVDRTVDAHIFSLRKKLGEKGSQCIETCRGLGYRFK